MKNLIFISVSFLISPLFANASPGECVQVAIMGEFHRPTSWAAQPFGLEISRGVSVAIDELWKKPHNLCPNIIPIDINNSLANIPDLIRNRIKESHVKVFIGLGISEQAIVASQAIQGLSAILITPTSSSDRLSEANHQVIMMFPTNQQIAGSLAKAAIKIGIRSIATVFSENSEYSKDLASAFKASFVQQGGRVKIQIGTRLGQITNDDLIRLKTVKVDRVFLPLYELDTARVISYLHQSGISTKFIGSDAWGTYSEVLRKYTDEIPIHAIYPAIYSHEMMNPTNLKFVSEYRRRYKRNPTDLAAFSYDGLKLADRLFSNCSAEKVVRSTTDCVRASLPFSSTTGPLLSVARSSLGRQIQYKKYLGK